MNGIKSLALIVCAFSASIIAMGVFTYVQNQKSIAEKASKAQTVQQCAQIATYEASFSGFIYKLCVEDAGFKTQIK